MAKLSIIFVGIIAIVCLSFTFDVPTTTIESFDCKGTTIIKGSNGNAFINGHDMETPYKIVRNSCTEDISEVIYFGYN